MSDLESKGYRVEFDFQNGEALIYRKSDDACVDRLDLWDDLLAYEQACHAKARECINQNAWTYNTAKHNWFKEA